MLSQKAKIWYPKTRLSTKTNWVSGGTLIMQNAKLRCCSQTTIKECIADSDFKDQCTIQKLATNIIKSRDQLIRILKRYMYNV